METVRIPSVVALRWMQYRDSRVPSKRITLALVLHQTKPRAAIVGSSRGQQMSPQLGAHAANDAYCPLDEVPWFDTRALAVRGAIATAINTEIEKFEAASGIRLPRLLNQPEESSTVTAEGFIARNKNVI